MRMNWRERKFRDTWEDTDDIYDEMVIEELLEDDELSTGEEAFMRGYDKENEREIEDYY